MASGNDWGALRAAALVLIIAIVVAAYLVMYGVISPSMLSPKTCSLDPGFPLGGCEDFDLSSDGALYLVFRAPPGLNGTVAVTGVECTARNASSGAWPAGFEPVAFSARQKKTVAGEFSNRVVCTDGRGKPVSLGDVTGFLKETVFIRYDDGSGEKTASGNLTVFHFGVLGR